MFIFAVEQENVSGVFNGVAPGVTTQAEFSSVLGNVTGTLIMS
jgi:NAD dependent epimerase/dehydratase family enzyme